MIGAQMNKALTLLLLSLFLAPALVEAANNDSQSDADFDEGMLGEEEDPLDDGVSPLDGDEPMGD